MSTLSTVAAPTGPRGFVAKTGALAAGTALAGAALLGGAVVTPAIPTAFAASVQQEFTLTATPSFEDSLQALLTTLNYGTMGDVLHVFGPTIGTDSTVGDLLATFNPTHVSLDTMTMGLLTADITDLLNNVQIGGVGLGDMPIDALVGSLLGAGGASTTFGDLLNTFNMGQYAGLLDIPALGLSPDDTVVGMLNTLLGINDTTTLGALAFGDGTLGDATLGGMLGLTSTQLEGGWDQFIGGLDLTGAGALGDETLGGFLGSLVGSTDALTDTTTVTDVLGDLGLFGLLDGTP